MPKRRKGANRSQTMSGKSLAVFLIKFKALFMLLFPPIIPSYLTFFFPQISCVRLLELLPLVYGRVNTNCRTQSCSMMTVFQDPMDISWFVHLVYWGKSSLLVIIRHWKQCMLSLLKELKCSHSSTIQRYIEDLDNIISHG